MLRFLLFVLFAVLLGAVWRALRRLGSAPGASRDARTEAGEASDTPPFDPLDVVEGQWEDIDGDDTKTS